MEIIIIEQIENNWEMDFRLCKINGPFDVAFDDEKMKASGREITSLFIIISEFK